MLIHMLFFAASVPATALSPVDATALHASFDPSLGSLRAGRTEAPAALAAHERSVLAAAETRSPALAALRAGYEPTSDQWRWLAIGGLVVLLIVLI